MTTALFQNQDIAKQSAVDFISGIESQGWKKNDEAFLEGTSLFISPDSKKVLRVNTINDYAFQAYAELCMDNPDNPYFQQVYESFVLPDGTHVAQMQKLLLGSVTQEESLLLQQFVFNPTNHLSRLKDHFADQHLCTAFKKLYELIDLRSRTNACLLPSLDLNMDNIMARPTQSGYQLVLTDPLEVFSPAHSQMWSFMMYPGQTKLRRMLGIKDAWYMSGFDNLQQLIFDQQ